jgi:hypothetical protein
MEQIKWLFSAIAAIGLTIGGLILAAAVLVFSAAVSLLKMVVLVAVLLTVFFKECVDAHNTK